MSAAAAEQRLGLRSAHSGAFIWNELHAPAVEGLGRRWVYLIYTELDALGLGQAFKVLLVV